MKGKHFVQVFFVLRKKDNQVTFLHLYHHTMVLLTVWVLTKFVPGTVKRAKVGHQWLNYNVANL
jgi:hypothetical protein